MGYTRIRQKRNELLISSPLVNPRRSERRGFFSIHKGRRQKRRKSRAKKTEPPFKEIPLLQVLEHTGLEPVTSTLPVWRAPNCANAPHALLL